MSCFYKLSFFIFAYDKFCLFIISILDSNALNLWSDIFQVDAMLQKLEKEIDDVDAKIGDRWRLLDRFAHCFLELV